MEGIITHKILTTTIINVADLKVVTVMRILML